MKGYYLRIKKTAQYKAMQDKKREKRFSKSKRYRSNTGIDEKMKNLRKFLNRYFARYNERVRSRLERRLCRYIRGERDYSKGLKNGL